jgi:DNA-binding MarR family transcriptional regulator
LTAEAETAFAPGIGERAEVPPRAEDGGIPAEPLNEPFDERFIRFSHATESVLKAITRYKNDCLNRFGLRGMHLMTMISLYRDGIETSGGRGLTSSDLCRICAVDKAFVSRVTGELKRLGYLDSAGNGGRYNARVSLTERGRTVTREIYALLNDAVSRITRDVPAEDVETFYGVLARFGENLAQLNGKSVPESGEEPDGN